MKTVSREKAPFEVVYENNNVVNRLEPVSMMDCLLEESMPYVWPNLSKKN